MSTPSRNTIPFSSSFWGEQVKGCGLSNHTIHDLELHSASQMGLEQFLMLRVIWQRDNRTASQSAKFLKATNLEHWITVAQASLEGCVSWNIYWQNFTAPRIPSGTFALARKYQLKAAKTEEQFLNPSVVVTPVAHRTRSRAQRPQTPIPPPVFQTPTKADHRSFDTPQLIEIDNDDDNEDGTSSPPSVFQPSPIGPDGEFMFPPTKDEQIVNTALIVFLDSLSMHLDLSIDWTLHRKSLVARFSHAKFEARTDGYLASKSQNALAIIEVKPMLRGRKETEIRMQESAEMVAWIMDDCNSGRTLPIPRVLVSQDRQHIFLTVAKFDQLYIDYLLQGVVNAASPPFLTMHEFGPWDTTDARAIKELGPILLALMLKADATV